MKTTRLLRDKMKLAPEQLQVVFQSRFGRAEWLQPYAQGTIEGLPGKGVKEPGDDYAGLLPIASRPWRKWPSASMKLSSMRAE